MPCPHPGCLLEKGTIAAATEQPLIILNVPELDNVFYLKVIDGALVSAKAHGYRLLINDFRLTGVLFTLLSIC